jgi:hypothetical protein
MSPIFTGPEGKGANKLAKVNKEKKNNGAV